MSDKRWTLALEILANNTALLGSIRDSQSSINKFKAQAQRDFQSIGRVWTSTMGKAMAIGGGLGAGKLLMDSAKLDHTLNQIAISAGKTRAEARAVKEELATLGTNTGTGVEELAQSFKSLVSYTGSWDAARESIKAVNTAVAVTGVSAEELGTTLATVSEQFHIDLTQPKAAANLLDKMAAIGKGSGGLANTARLISEISLRAKMTGMNADDALKFIGVIGNVSKNPAQMNAVAESTLRMFTNLRALKHMRGVKIFDETGAQRNPLLILKEVGEAYKKLDNKGQDRLLGRLFNNDKGASQGLQAIFKSDALDKLDSIGKSLKESSGGLEKKLPDTLDDAEVAAKRLGELLKKAGDDFAQPINNVFSHTIQHSMDKLNLKEVGGAGIGAAALGAVITSWYLGKTLKELPGGFGKLLGGKVGLVSGVAEGALMSKMGIQPVYVVNFSEMGSSIPGLSGGKFEEYLPGGGKTDKTGGIGKVAQYGPVAMAAGMFGISIWAAMQEKYRKMADEMRGGYNMQGGVASGSGFNPDELYRSANAGLDYSNNGGSPDAPSSIINKNDWKIDVYVENNKAKIRTVSTGRGHFTTSAITDSDTRSSEE